MSKLNSFAQRTVTGLLMVALMVVAIIYSPQTFAIFFALLVFGILWEFYNLINVSKEVSILRLLHSLAGTGLFICVFFEASHLTTNWVFVFYGLYLIGMFISRLYTRQRNPLRELAYILMGQLYIAFPLSLLASIAFHTKLYSMDRALVDYSPIFVLSLFFFIWINDTGAYLTGMTCSKLMKTHRLFPRVSPKKTWEGFWGGLLFSVLLGWGLSYDALWTLLGIDLSEGVRLTTLEWIGMGLFTSIFSTFGDLVESFFKRAVGVKDSGNILPGHGGLWDRFDSLILATPALQIYLILIALL